MKFDEGFISPTGRNYLSKANKEEIVREFFLEGASKSTLARKYKSSFGAISRIVSKFEAENEKSTLLMKNKPSDDQTEELKALRKEVLSLKKQLRDEQMRADFYETMVDVAEGTFNIEIRKKAGTGQSKGCTEKKDIQ
jgi:transposase-like protein